MGSLKGPFQQEERECLNLFPCQQRGEREYRHDRRRKITKKFISVFDMNAKKQNFAFVTERARERARLRESAERA
jgi:hypothetical protein